MRSPHRRECPGRQRRDATLVERGNRVAVRLYERHGFVVVAESGGALTMRVRLPASPRAAG
jgi:hypothetical protein